MFPRNEKEIPNKFGKTNKKNEKKNRHGSSLVTDDTIVIIDFDHMIQTHT